MPSKFQVTEDIFTQVKKFIPLQKKWETVTSYKRIPLAAGSDIAGRYNDKGLFPYEWFVKLYNFNKLELHPFGLINCGNSCYANAVLQCLAFTPPLTAYLLQGLHSKSSCSPKESRMHVREENPLRTQGIQSKFSSQTSDAFCKGYNTKHRRGKSETLRAQYINTKEVRVTIGTWNVAGRIPSEDLEIDDWLCAEDPSDIYIIGFQEVVPLSAGNVLGAEDNTPIRKWESIIRRSLNKSAEPDSKHKSHSAPPSPVLRTSSAADVLAESIDAANPIDMNMMNEEYIRTVDKYELKQLEENNIISVGNDLHVRKIYGLDLDWPERPLDAISQIVDSNPKLRRVLSSSDRIGFNLNENAFIYGSGLKRSHHSSGNLGLTDSLY